MWNGRIWILLCCSNDLEQIQRNLLVRNTLANKEHVNGLYRDLCREMRGPLEAGIEPEQVTIK